MPDAVLVLLRIVFVIHALIGSGYGEAEISRFESEGARGIVQSDSIIESTGTFLVHQYGVAFDIGKIRHRHHGLFGVGGSASEGRTAN
ncbi:MAG: hypothetical protein R3D26_08295 [Cyanobacteriota/Melainabacteria group bacterium]